MASITIRLGDDVLKSLAASRSITITLRSEVRARGGAGTSNGFRAGSLPDRLLTWAGSRKQPFGVQEVMKKIKVTRAHASMLLTRTVASGRLKRVGRGAYVVA